jgi:DNA polymerase-1
LNPLDQFRAVWLVDFEFSAPPGERPTPVCLVAREYRSGRTTKIFQDVLSTLRAPPYPVGPEDLFCAYYASAEVGCHLALGWPSPAQILDLYTEFRCLTNGLPTPNGWNLLGALLWFGLDAMSAVEKQSMRSLAMRGGPFTPEERVALLDYCESDVLSLARLLPVMLPRIDLPRALLRGRYMAAAARIERTGIPIDTGTFTRLHDLGDEIRGQLISELDIHGMYESQTFKMGRFADWLSKHDLSWPYTDSGTLVLDEDTFLMMRSIYPEVATIADLRDLLSQSRLCPSLTIGRDGRNRCLLSPFASQTGRNQPSNAKFVFGPAAWLRGLIQPGPGQAVAYVDWSQQEFGIAAALSNDPVMMAAYRSGDPYLAFGKQAGRIPPDGIEQTHAAEREAFKTCVLGVQYSMGAFTLATRIGQSPAHARELLELHRTTYPKFWAWSDQAEIVGMLHGRLRTVFGWTLHTTAGVNPRSLRNFPCQANGAEMLRLACCLATERGVEVAAPVHDALLIEGPADAIEDVVAETQRAMQEASEIVLDGFALRSKTKIVRHPDRLLDDKKTRPMWDRIMGIMDSLDSPRAMEPVQN